MQEKNAKNIFIPSYIKELEPYKPGKSSDIDSFSRYKAILCSNENNLGPSPKAMEAIKSSVNEINTYPDPTGQKVVDKLKILHKVNDENIILSNGLDGLLYTLFKAFTQPLDEVISSEYSFVAFNKFSKMNNVILKKAKMTKRYEIDLNAMSGLISDRTKIIYICNPNNPTGTAVDENSLLDFLKKVPKNILVVIDEAYIEFAKKKDSNFPDTMDNKFDNVLSLRTLSKVYGLAGLRIGYGVSSDYVIAALKKVKLVFNPNSLAQTAACAALDDKLHLDKTLENNHLWKSKIEAVLTDIKLKYLNSFANFITIIFTDINKSGDFFEYMDKNGILLRKLDGFELPEAVRMSIGNEKEMEYTLQILKKYKF